MLSGRVCSLRLAEDAENEICPVCDGSLFLLSESCPLCCDDNGAQSLDHSRSLFDHDSSDVFGRDADRHRCVVCEDTRYLLSESCPLCCGTSRFDDKYSPTSFFCDVCKKDLQSAASLAGHELGRRHLYRQAIAAAGAPVGSRLGASLHAACAPPHFTEESLFECLAAGRFSRIIVCTGAGVSTAAGIADFRSPGGLFQELRAKFGGRFPEVLQNPEVILSRSFARRNPDFWKGEMEPWLCSWKCSSATPTVTHRFCAWLHRRGWLKRIYTQNVDGLHVQMELGLPVEKLVECHGALRDGSIVLYGDSLPRCFEQRCAEDFPSSFDPECSVDLILVLGTSLQVAPFCALPNMAPRGCTRVLVNHPLSDCLSNAWTPEHRDNEVIDLAIGFGRQPPATTRIAQRSVQLRPLWFDKGANKRWSQLLVESSCDAFVNRFFASPGARAAQLCLDV